MNVAPHKAVTIEYTLTDEAGQVLDSSQGREALTYLHGGGNIVPGLERALEGRSVGDAVDVSVAPEDGYGVRNERLVQNIAIRKLPEGKAAVGQWLRVEGAHGPQMLVVTAVRGDYASVDANHPLAGKTLRFAVKITAIRDATEEERTHGHVHGGDGHGHH